MTFVLCGLLSSGCFLQKRDPTRNVNIALQALRPLLSSPPPARKLLREFRALRLFPLPLPAL